MIDQPNDPYKIELVNSEQEEIYDPIFAYKLEKSPAELALSLIRRVISRMPEGLEVSTEHVVSVVANKIHSDLGQKQIPEFDIDVVLQYIPELLPIAQKQLYEARKKIEANHEHSDSFCKDILNFLEIDPYFIIYVAYVAVTGLQPENIEIDENENYVVSEQVEKKLEMLLNQIKSEIDNQFFAKVFDNSRGKLVHDLSANYTECLGDKGYNTFSLAGNTFQEAEFFINMFFQSHTISRSQIINFFNFRDDTVILLKAFNAELILEGYQEDSWQNKDFLLRFIERLSLKLHS